MTAQTATLADFLLARVAEDETEAHRWIARRQSWSGESFDVFTAGSEERVLAECEAKRRIVRDWLLRDEQGQMDGGEVFGYHATGVKQAVRRLAEVYSDHPDYNPNW